MSSNGKKETKEDARQEESHNEVILGHDELQGLFTTSEHTDNTRLLLTPGEDLVSLMMRTSAPSKKFVLALSLSLQECEEHHYKDGQQFYKNIMAGLPSVKDRRPELFVDAIIGERNRMAGGRQPGAWQKLKSWAMGGGQE